jgi:hypothetical protein
MRLNRASASGGAVVLIGTDAQPAQTVAMSTKARVVIGVFIHSPILHAPRMVDD